MNSCAHNGSRSLNNALHLMQCITGTTGVTGTTGIYKYTSHPPNPWTKKIAHLSGYTHYWSSIPPWQLIQRLFAAERSRRNEAERRSTVTAKIILLDSETKETPFGFHTWWGGGGVQGGLGKMNSDDFQNIPYIIFTKFGRNIHKNITKQYFLLLRGASHKKMEISKRILEEI